jgi:hypothetical protein
MKDRNYGYDQVNRDGTPVNGTHPALKLGEAVDMVTGEVVSALDYYGEDSLEGDPKPVATRVQLKVADQIRSLRVMRADISACINLSEKIAGAAKQHDLDMGHVTLAMLIDCLTTP